MAIRGTRKIAVCAMVAGATLAVGMPDAGAQNLFERLFGGGNRMNRPYTQQQQQEPRDATPKEPAPKISSPSYYNYTADSPSRVDLSRIASASESIPLAAAIPDPAFRDALADSGDVDLYAEDDIAEALVAHYSARPEFMWVEGFEPNDRARAALRALREAESYGLSEIDYAVPVASGGFAGEKAATRLEKLVRLEMTLSARVLRYIKDAHGGRVDPNGLSGYHDFAEKPLDLREVLETFPESDDVGEYIASHHPGNEEYKALRAELETLRASAENEIDVDPDTFARPGGEHADFPKLLRIIERDADEAFLAEHGELLDEHATSERYDEALVPVIKAAQRAGGLHTDGIVGPRTVAAIAGESKAARIEKVLLAMERLRWHPSDLGDPHVVINAAAYTATFTEGGEDRLSMRAVVGKTSNQTSFFHDEIEYVEFNPYWGVPQSIIVNEMLPKLREDPGYLDKAGYEVTTKQGERVSSASIDWMRFGSDVPLNVKQPPGRGNALGELKIMFPNSHAIYMHDTPERHLFERDSRAFSHGCVRLHHPREMAAAVLDWSTSQVRSRLNEGHNKKELPRDIPVYVAYFTAWPDSGGEIAYHGDVYDRDDRLQTALDKVKDARAPSS